MNPGSERRPVVYGLRAGESFGYVGSTTVNLTHRWWQHKSRARTGHQAPVYEWMRLVGIENVQAVELATGEDLRKLEHEVIVRLRSQGHPLNNQSGIDGVPNSMSYRSRQKLSAARRGHDSWIKGKRGEDAGWTAERRAAFSAARRDTTYTGEREPGKQIPAHGLRARYDGGCRCEKCVAVVERMTARAAGALTRTHGTVASYKHGKCRCEECRTAYRDYQRRFTSN